jgi:hypothetical protein
MSYADYEFVLRVMTSGDACRLGAMAALVDSFPGGIDPFLGRRWIIAPFTARH